MRSIQIEAWALEIIDQLHSKSRVEDSRVELKSEWINPQKAARQLAGHSNAARGESILWLIGVDEEKGVIGASHEELANWYNSVQTEFDGIAPLLLDLNIPVNGKTIVALYFDTDRAPYVIRNPSFGVEKGVAISHEVPWREGTKTRSATRSELLKILVPNIQLPDVDILSGKLVVSFDNAAGTWNWRLTLRTYITPQIGMSCILPYHQSEASFEILNQLPLTNLTMIRLFPPYNKHKVGSQSPFAQEPDSLTIGHTQDEAIIEGPGRLDITAQGSTEASSVNLVDTTARIKILITPSHSDKTIRIDETFKWTTPEENNIGMWVLRKAT